MCKVSVVLDTIKSLPNNGGVPEMDIKLHEAVAEDLSDMQKDIKNVSERMTKLEKKFDILEGKVDGLDEKVDLLIKMAEKKEPTFYEKILGLKDAKMMWIAIIVSLLIVGSLLGANLEWIKGAFSITG